MVRPSTHAATQTPPALWLEPGLAPPGHRCTSRFAHADSGSAARACCCAPDVTCCSAARSCNELRSLRTKMSFCANTLYCVANRFAPEYSMLRCPNRHANAELGSLRIGTSLLHDTIDTRRATAPALWVTAPCQASPSLHRTAPSLRWRSMPRVAPIDAWLGRPVVCHGSAWCRRHVSLTAPRASIGG